MNACLLDPNGQDYTGDTLYLISGDANCGVYEMCFTISESDFDPVDSYELGDWRVRVFMDEDVSGNQVVYDEKYHQLDF